MVRVVDVDVVVVVVVLLLGPDLKGQGQLFFGTSPSYFLPSLLISHS